MSALPWRADRRFQSSRRNSASWLTLSESMYIRNARGEIVVGRNHGFSAVHGRPLITKISGILRAVIIAPS